MATTSDFKTGLVIELDGELYSILNYTHVKPGKGRAFLKTKMKKLKTGLTVDKSFRAGEKINKAFLEDKKVEYLYKADDFYYFLDQSTYEELVLTSDQIGDASRYLKENEVCTLLIYKGNVVSVQVPIFVELEVMKTDPGVRGDTVSGGVKPAILEAGVHIQVPLFVNEGDTVRVDTRTGEYVERV